MVVRRDRCEIVIRILEICKQPDTSKTKIVYQANLNFKSVEPYLKHLQKEGFIIKVGSHFRTLPRGDEALSCLKKMEDILGTMP